MVTEEISLQGVVERVTYYNPENGFTVLKLKVSGQQELVSTTGSAAVKVGVGESVALTGYWFQDQRYGLQFKMLTLQPILPNTVLGIERYLSSGIVKGIGKSIAKKIVTEFGEEALDILENHPEALASIPGIGERKAIAIAESWKQNKVVRDILIFLQGYQISASLGYKIYRHYGEGAIRIVKEDPYRLARDIKGVGFISADKIALSLGISPTSPHRSAAAIEYLLLEASNDGSCALPIRILASRAMEYIDMDEELLLRGLKIALDACRVIAVREDGVVVDSIDDMIADGSMILLFNARYFYLEKNIASRLRDIVKVGESVASGIDVEEAITAMRDQEGIMLSAEQEDAIRILRTSKLLVITGGPGTGKTTLVRSIIKIVRGSRPGLKIKLAAPTGRAAKRLAESTGYRAATIHRLLEFSSQDGKFKYGDDCNLPCDLLIIDECSMLDVNLAMNVLKAVSPMTTVIMVGDVDQLPPVGPGQVLADIISTGVVATVRLQKIFRQAAFSGIVTNAHLVNKGIVPKLAEGQKGDFWFIENSSDITTVLRELLTKVIPTRMSFSAEEVLHKVQLLSPMQKGEDGVRNLNVYLQGILNENKETYVERIGQRYCLGDKVIQTENNYDKYVFNGDIGVIVLIDHENQEVQVNFDDHIVTYDFMELEQLSLAYAITVHKAQGSEYPVVVMVMTMRHFIMLNRNLLYTAITRAKRLAIVVGEKRAIATATKSTRNAVRYTMLRHWLLQNFSEDKQKHHGLTLI